MNSPLPALAALLQSTFLQADMVRAVLISAAFALTAIVVLIVVFRKVRRDLNVSISDEIEAEFNKKKDMLLLAAAEKKAAKEREEGARRAAEKDEKERELLRENVDPLRVIGRLCPLSGMEMLVDTDLIIDPYSGQGYHLSSFLNDWPPDSERPRFIYRYPQGTVVRTSDFLKSW